MRLVPGRISLAVFEFLPDAMWPHGALRLNDGV